MKLTVGVTLHYYKKTEHRFFAIDEKFYGLVRDGLQVDEGEIDVLPLVTHQVYTVD